MKRKILVCLLALWVALTVLPLTVQASEGYKVSAKAAEGGEHGCVELSVDHAAAGETVWLRAEPEAGYLAQIDGFCGAGPVRPSYAGLGMYAFDMPEGDVELQVRFVPAEGALYPITGTVNDPAWGELTIRRGEAREGEWVVVEVRPEPGCVLASLTALGTDGLPVRGGYAGTREDVLLYEYCLPNAGVVIEAEFAEDQYLTPEQSVFLLGKMRCLLRWMTELWFATLLP